MTAKEIGNFLGVSVKTVHSRLHRARKRLQQKEELLISEVLGAVQLPHPSNGEHHKTSCQHETDTTTSWETAATVGGFWGRLRF